MIKDAISVVEEKVLKHEEERGYAPSGNAFVEAVKSHNPKAVKSHNAKPPAARMGAGIPPIPKNGPYNYY